MNYLTTPCIIYTGALFKATGYGKQWHEGTDHRAHRVAYALSKGLPMSAIAGVVIRHKCDNPSCVNPEHLEPGTQSDNIMDSVERGRHRGGFVRRKLSDDDVRAIRGSPDTQLALALRYGMSQNGISLVLKGKTYKDVT